MLLDLDLDSLIKIWISNLIFELYRNRIKINTSLLYNRLLGDYF